MTDEVEKKMDTSSVACGDSFSSRRSLGDTHRTSGLAAGEGLAPPAFAPAVTGIDCRVAALLAMTHYSHTPVIARLRQEPWQSFSPSVSLTLDSSLGEGATGKKAPSLRELAAKRSEGVCCDRSPDYALS